jgi:hypothetical protein
MSYYDFLKSRSIDIEQCQSVCLALGPYRNLTTLTAATLFLHPCCQVLNHAGDRIFGNPRVDFLARYNRSTMDRFIRFAIQSSIHGKRGEYGGSIIHSHALTGTHPMRGLFQKKKIKRLKNSIQCLFWKESLRTANYIRSHNINLFDVLRQDDRLRFLMPIRNPLDCAQSNMKGHFRSFDGLSDNPSVQEVLQAVLEEIRWFIQLKDQFPERFFYYFEYNITRSMFGDLARFLRLEPDAEWMKAALDAMEIQKKYEHAAELKEFFEQYVKEHFAAYPEVQKGLLVFSQSHDMNVKGV